MRWSKRVCLTIALLATAPAFAQEAAEEPQTLAERITAAALPKIVKVYGAGGFKGIPAYGSGCLIDGRGMVLTAWSVALKTERLLVVDDEGRKAEASLHRYDPALGVALLKYARAPKKALPVFALADSSAVKVGQMVFSFGNAFDVAVGNEKPGVTEGVIAAIADLDPRLGVMKTRLQTRVFLTDAANNPGTQGGPLLDSRGRLIGINGRVVDSRSTNTPLNYAVPVHAVKAFVAEGVANWDKAAPEKALAPEPEEAVRRLVLGFRVLRFHFNRAPPAYIDEVLPSSPASRAGLRVDDLIFQVDGRTVRSTEELDRAIEAMKPGVAVVFTVKRGDNIIKAKLTPETEAGKKKE